MPNPRLRLLALVATVCALVALVVGVGAAPVSAHNSLVSSDPADGALLDIAPTRITWLFDRSVPLETLTVTLVDASGVRTEVTGSVHGPTGDAEVVTPLPALQAGEVSLRWRLVGPDGHPVTGRVEFTIAGSTATTAPAAETATSATTVPPADTTAADSAADSADSDIAGAAVDDDAGFSTPSWARWLLRYGSYLAIMSVVGILLTSAVVWAGAGAQPLLRKVLSWSLLVTAALGFVQLMVLASDVSATAPWSAFDAVDAALSLDAGMAYAVRIVLALAMWLLLFEYDLPDADVYWSAISLPALALLGTWAFAGHSRSMRWPVLGVLTDVAHHAAAAAWIGGLAIVGWIVIPTAVPAVLVPVVRRFSTVAAVSVAVLVVTGLVQSARLVGAPGDLLAADHGRYLVAKLAILAAMLGLASVNRRRVDRRLDDVDTLPRHVRSLRQAMLAEVAIGLVIIAVTAAMVVSPPATSNTEQASAAPFVLEHPV